jgi:hypothetical protein
VSQDTAEALRLHSPGWLDERGRKRLLVHWKRQAGDHVAQVLRVAQLAAWERLFALWHVLHIPFVYVMVICAIAHVVAVHAY